MREMMAADIGMGPLDVATRKCVDAIFDDIRGRRTLKWFFHEEGEGKICEHFSVFPRDAQRDMAEVWGGIIRAVLEAQAAGS